MRALRLETERAMDAELVDKTHILLLTGHSNNDVVSM